MHVSIITTLASFFTLLLPTCFALDPTQLLYEFPNGTWIENLAVRPSGSVLLTIITSPDLYLINPLTPNPKPTLIHHFSSGLWLAGITETNPETFYVVVANGTLKPLEVAPGSSSIYRVRFPSSSPDSSAEISLAATLPDAIFLNSLITLTPTTLLASDSTKGVVWAIDTRTGASHIAIKDPLMSPAAPLPTLGINGIKLLGNTLYFANSAQGIFAKVLIDLHSGSALGPATKISDSAPGTAYDDFALSRAADAAFVATGGGDSIAEVKLDDGKTTIIAGRVNETQIAEPTAAQFGRTESDRDILYVTTGGGLAIPVDGDKIVGGQFLAVDTGVWGV